MKFMYLNIVAPASVIIPMLTGLIRLRALNKGFRALVYYLCITLAASTLNTLLIQNAMGNLFVFHIYTPIEALFLLQFFSCIIYDSRILKSLHFLKIIFPAYCLAIYLFSQNNKTLNSYTRSVEALLIIGLCFYYWWQNSKQDAEISWTDQAANWVVSGLLLYFSGALFYFVFSNILRSGYDIAINILILNINATLVIVMNLLFAVGFYKFRR